MIKPSYFIGVNMKAIQKYTTMTWLGYNFT